MTALLRHDWRSELSDAPGVYRCVLCGETYACPTNAHEPPLTGCPHGLTPPEPETPTKRSAARRPAAKLESEILNEIRSALARVDSVTVWRNSSGRLPDAHGRWIPYGLGKGSADLVGLVTMRLPSPGHWQHAPDQCGPHAPWTIGRMFCLEVKRPGEKLRPDQVLWAAHVRRLGGFCCVAYCAEDAVAAVERCRSGLSE